MNKEEIKEYLQRVEELELKLVGEDRDTLQWLIFGYNECARLLNEVEQENQLLKIQVSSREEVANKYKEVIEEVRECLNTPWILTDYETGEQIHKKKKDLLQILDKGESNEKTKRIYIIQR